MAANGFAPVLEALNVMQSNAKKDQKERAHEFLNQFQKSKDAWASTHSILQDSSTSTESKLFAATTLKGKITYDLDQLPRTQLTGLRDSLLSFLTAYADGPKPIRTALCVCLAILAIQMTEWKDVLQSVGAALGSSAGDCVLEFLQVLPEELYEGRKINLSEEDLDARTKELVEDNIGNMLQLLINYSASSPKAASNPLLLDCITSWLREIPIAQIIGSPLLDTIFNGVGVESTFEAAIECLTSIFRDTREVDDSMDLIQILYPRLLVLRSKIQEAAESDESETLRGIARIFAEAGEAWVALIARMPQQFRGLVEAILECCVRDKGTEAVRVTFNFWFDFKQMITMEKWAPARNAYLDIWSSLTDTMVKHLEYPRPEDGGEADLFDGDREAEERFREFRHEMGDVLKDCCHVITTTECLAKSYQLIQEWISVHASQVSGTTIPNWQALEAPLFAFRAMGREVPPDEDSVLPQMMPLLVQIPKHSKLLYQAVMAVGRYTEWIFAHPEYLQPQFKFILESMEFPDIDVVRAAALSFRHLGEDCRYLLKDELVPVQVFYERTLDKLPLGGSQEELTQGVAMIASAQPPEKIYEAMKLLCDPVIERVKARASLLKADPTNRTNIDSLSDALGFVTIFVNSIQPRPNASQPNQAVAYCQEIFPVLAAVCENFTTVEPILESVCRCWRNMVIAYRTEIFPLLEPLAGQLATGFETTRQGCFLWATDAVLREFALGVEHVDPATTKAIYNFFEQQAFAFLKVMNDLPPRELGDVIEDFFRMLQDALMYYHDQLLPAAISSPILTAAISALALEAQEPLLQTLHWLRDLFTYGTDQPASSKMVPADEAAAVESAAAEAATNKAAVLDLARAQGQQLVRALLTGMMFTFPSDCLHDASGVVLGLYRVAPRETAAWVGQTIDLLPSGSVRPGDKDKLLAAVDRIASNPSGEDDRKVRSLVADFTTSYRRRNVMPREGLGPLEPARFRYKG